MTAGRPAYIENLRVALGSVGAGFEQVVKLNLYLLDATQLPVVHEVRDQYVNTTPPPASTAVQVGGLALEGLLIEVEASPSSPDRPPAA